ncbi:MAG: flagellar type III secretion system pore protein FliP [Bdellovibrionaceae bacterium]|nr:flagellar type III secretion system pore protein FliP [Pseudobdellovibrionaceae bacterium]
MKNKGHFLFLSFIFLTFGSQLMAQVTLPSVNLGFKTAENPNEIVNAIKIVLVLTVLTLAPAILIMMTSFTRLIIVFSFLRQAMGVQQMPPNQLLVGLSLFLTFFIMGPTFEELNQKGVQPFLAGKISQEKALDETMAPLRRFMFHQTRDSDLSLFLKLGKVNQPRTRADVPSLVLIPAFVLSEIKTAFQIGFIIFLPFLVIDIVASSVLMAMGMMMLPPIVISLPLKIMLFVLVDGWALLIGSMVKSFG